MKWEEKTDVINKEFEMWQDEIEGIEEIIESLKEEVILRPPNK